MVISEAFKMALWRHRSRGGRMWKLAAEVGMTPSTFSATVSGARRVDDYDPRIVAIGEQLGLKPDECFEPEDAVAS